MIVGVWTAYILSSEERKPSVTLPDGVRVTYHGGTSGPVTYDNGAPIFVVHPTPGMKSWDLALVPETVTQVEFTVQAPPVNSSAGKN